MTNNFDKFKRLVVILLVAVGFFYGGYYSGKRGFVFEVRKNPPYVEIINKYPKDQTVDFSLFWDVWDEVSKNYLERPVDTKKMLYGAISGMVSSLGDPYTAFLAPEVNKTITSALNGNYQGIGAELGINKDSQLVVVSPLEGSPAKAAGVMAGDVILEIEGQPSVNMTVSEAVSKIRGDSGTMVTLKLLRVGKDAFVTRIQRGVINVPSITWEDKGEGTAYIRISRFGADTNESWTKIAQEVNVKMPELDAIILDLRGNPGGYLQSAVYIAGEFFKNKPVVWQEDSLGNQTSLNTDRIGNFQSIPAIFVLIDEGSASASEILAAALRVNIKAKLIGVKSFGKGTIQDTQDFKDGAGLHITIAKWLTPDKQWIHKVGLQPDVVVPITEENITDKVDPQLDKAIELAKEV